MDVIKHLVSLGADIHLKEGRGRTGKCTFYYINSLWQYHTGTIIVLYEWIMHIIIAFF